jgi:hypothetical protein
VNYVADPYIPHDELDEIVAQRGKEGWQIHTILPVKHTDTTDSVTVIWEASPKRAEPEGMQMPPEAGGFFPSESGEKRCTENEHEFDQDHKCLHCGMEIQEFIRDHPQSVDS